MLKAVLAAIVGYIVMVVVVFTTFSGSYLAMGADGAFRPGTYDVSLLWIVVSLVLAIIAAVIGGTVASRIGGPTGVKVLAGLVVVLGLLSALPVLSPETDPRPKVRTDAVGNMEAMTNARQPAWNALLMPFLGAAGVLAGGRSKR